MFFCIGSQPLLTRKPYLCTPKEQPPMCETPFFSPQTQTFIAEHRHDDIRTLALQAGKYSDVNMSEVVTQVAGWQIADKKVSTFARTEGIVYPKHLSMEQCSSEATARYKAALVEGETMADLTAGFGVDCSFLARRFRTAHYVERQEELCRIATHNFPLLGLNHVNIHHQDGTEFLKTMPHMDCIFLDPARRDAHGGKTVAIADCEPNVEALEELLVEKASTVMVKLSPMLDVASALHGLKHVRKVHIVALNNECKEIIVILQSSDNKDIQTEQGVIITCSQLVENSVTQTFSYQQQEEACAVCRYADQPSAYLYEPGASLLKAGPYKLISERFGLAKLHPNSHLYTADTLTDFPGRRFRVEAVSGFGKKELKAFLTDTPKANLTVRNFPMTVADLRKKLKLKEGGDTYLFATTLHDGEKVLIKCKRT